MPTVIDSLVVTLGLDPAKFISGQKQARNEFKQTQEQAGKSTKETSQIVVKGAEEMTKAIRNAAAQFALAFLGFSGATGFVKFMANLNGTTRQLGFNAKNLDLSAASLRNWQDAADIAGASAESITGLFDAIQKQQYDLRTTGRFDDTWMKVFSAGGIKMVDASTGKFKSVDTVVMDIAKHLADVEKQYGRLYAVQRAKSLGLDPNLTNFLLQGPQRLQAMLAREKGTYQVTDGAVQAADRVARKFTEIQQRLRDFGIQLLVKLQPLIERLATKFEQWLGSVDLNKLSANIDNLVAAVVDLGKTIGQFISWVGGKQEAISHPGDAAANWLKEVGEYWQKRPALDNVIQNDPVLFKLRSKVSSDFSSNFPKDIGSLIDDSVPANDEAVKSQLMDTLTKATGKGQNDPLDKTAVWAIRKAIDDIAATRLKAAATTGANLGTPNAIAAATGAGPGLPAQMAQVAGASNSSSLQVGEINVYTNSGNGSQIAGDIRRELERKQLVAQGDYGLT
jgi:hypothetical protein